MARLHQLLGLMVVAIHSSASFAGIDQPYDLVLAAKTGDLSIVSIEPDISINDEGDVAFVAVIQEPGGATTENLFSYHLPTGVLANVAPKITSQYTPTMGPAVRANNKRQAIARRFELVPTPLGPAPYSYIETWNLWQVNQNSILVAAEALFSEFDGVYAFPSNNNLGGAVFEALDGSKNYLATITAGGNYKVDLQSELPHAAMADDNRFVMRLGSDTIAILPPYFFPIVKIAGPPQGFSLVGSEPGVADSGAAVAFIGAQGSGEGAFVAVADASGTYSIHRVAGEGSDGFSDFAEDQRVGIQCSMTGGVFQPFRIAFRAKSGGVDGVFTVGGHIAPGPTGSYVADVGTPSLVAAIGDSVGGRVVASLDLYDPLNGRGQIAMRATFTDGTDGVVIALPHPAELRRIRISAKRVLDPSGNAHPSWTRESILSVIDHATGLMRSANVDLVLQDITDVADPIGGALFNIPLTGVGPIEQQAITSPATFAWVPDCLNVYFVGSLATTSGVGLGVCSFPPDVIGSPSMSSQTCAVSPNQACATSPFAQDLGETLAHEVGHYLNLLHTFSATLFGAESPPPWPNAASVAPNSSLAGDLVADTPTDENIPTGSMLWSTSSPQFAVVSTNLMSYRCPISTFTPDQGRRMAQAIELFRGRTSTLRFGDTVSASIDGTGESDDCWFMGLEGTVVKVQAKGTDGPPPKVTLFDHQGKLIEKWTAKGQKKSYKLKSSLPYRLHVENPANAGNAPACYEIATSAKLPKGADGTTKKTLTPNKNDFGSLAVPALVGSRIDLDLDFLPAPTAPLSLSLVGADGTALSPATLPTTIAAGVSHLAIPGIAVPTSGEWTLKIGKVKKKQVTATVVVTPPQYTPGKIRIP